MKLANIFRGLAHAIFGWGFIQIILIGFAYFNAIPSSYHGYSGLLLEVMALLLLVVALIGRMGAKLIGLSLLLLVLLGGQGFFVHSPDLAPLVRGLHPVFGITAMLLARYLAGQAPQS
jgi:hypothetical protein